jgi:hypothetical protein
VPLSVCQLRAYPQLCLLRVLILPLFQPLRLLLLLGILVPSPPTRSLLLPLPLLQSLLLALPLLQPQLQRPL